MFSKIMDCLSGARPKCVAALHVPLWGLTFGSVGPGPSGGGGGWHEAMVIVCLPLAAPISLSSLYIPTLCGSERVLVVSTEPLDDLSCLTTPGSAVPVTGCCPYR